MNLRLVSATVLTRVIGDGQSLTLALEKELPCLEAAKDKAFVQALCYGVCRQYQLLDFILSLLLEKPLKDVPVKMLLMVGLYQLKFMRVKAHAAVSETVAATRKKPWAKALVNAILRKYIREEQAIGEQIKQHPPALLCHPEWLLRQIQEDWPEQAESVFYQNNCQPPMVLRVNLAKISRADYLQQLLALGMSATVLDFAPAALILEHPVTVDSLPGFNLGLVSVQDGAAQLAAPLLDLKPGQRVLDVCAAPGGKSAHILEYQPDLAELVAVDIDAERLQKVEANLVRLALQAKLVVGDAAQPEQWWDGQCFERILLDAPCSAVGVIRRHPDIKLLRKAEDILPLQILQQRILQAVWPLLAPGGILLYATCSIFKQENEQQIETFLNNHSDALVLPITQPWGISGQYGKQILTGDLAMDGFYYACLSKQA
ncbi:MAG: 16S rRNA (cytosine(967)-C(5))-methyltransferase RsmB [Methylococcaceae bacterium]